MTLENSGAIKSHEVENKISTEGSTETDVFNKAFKDIDGIILAEKNENNAASGNSEIKKVIPENLPDPEVSTSQDPVKGTDPEWDIASVADITKTEENIENEKIGKGITESTKTNYLNENIQTETKEVSQDDRILDFLNENSKYSDAEKSASVSIIKNLMTENEMSWEEISADSEFLFVLIEDPLKDWGEQQKENTKIKEKAEVKEKKAEVKEERTETKGYQETLDEILKEYEGKPTSELIKALLAVPNIPEKTKQNFEEYQKLLSFGKTEGFKESDQAVIESVVRQSLSDGKDIKVAVQKLYESPDLSNEARESLAEKYGIPRKIMPMRTEDEIEKASLEKKEHFDKTKKALAEKEAETKEYENRAKELKNKRDGGDPLTEQEEQDLADIEKRLGNLKKEQEELRQEVKDLSDPETGKLRFDFRLQVATVIEEGYGKFMELTWPSGRKYKIEINKQGRNLEKTYEKIVTFEGLGGPDGAGRYLMQIPNQNAVYSSEGKIGNMHISEMYRKLGLDRQEGVVMSSSDQKEFNQMMDCLNGPGTSLESLQRLGILTPQGILDNQKWEQTLSYMRENKNNQNFLNYRFLKEHLDRLNQKK